MTLRSETTVEYYFKEPYLFFCKHHDTLGISEAHGDSVQLNNITQEENIIETLTVSDDQSWIFQIPLHHSYEKNYLSEHGTMIEARQVTHGIVSYFHATHRLNRNNLEIILNESRQVL